MAAMASGSYKPPPKKQSATIPDPAVADAPLDPSTGLRLHCDVNGEQCKFMIADVTA